MCYSFILPSDPNLHANRWMNPRFKILSEIKDIETIASGRGVYIRRHLERTYGRGR